MSAVHNISSSSDECNITGEHAPNQKSQSDDSDDSIPELYKRIQMQYNKADGGNPTRRPNAPTHCNYIDLSSGHGMQVTPSI